MIGNRRYELKKNIGQQTVQPTEATILFNPSTNGQTEFTIPSTIIQIKSAYLNGVLLSPTSYEKDQNVFRWISSSFPLDITDSIYIIYQL